MGVHEWAREGLRELLSKSDEADRAMRACARCSAQSSN